MRLLPIHSQNLIDLDTFNLRMTCNNILVDFEWGSITIMYNLITKYYEVIDHRTTQHSLRIYSRVTFHQISQLYTHNQLEYHNRPLRLERKHDF